MFLIHVFLCAGVYCIALVLVLLQKNGVFSRKKPSTERRVVFLRLQMTHLVKSAFWQVAGKPC